MKSFNWYKTDRYFDPHNILQHHSRAIEKTRYKLGMQTSSESTDAKSDSLDEPSAYLIEKNVALPKDIFGSYLSYWIYEVTRHKAAVILLVLIVTSILLLVFFYNTEFCVAFEILLFSFCFPGTCMVVIAFSEPIGDREFKVKLLMEIITRKPAVKGKEWRTITYKMNQYLFDHGLWDTPYYFYRDEDCHRYFLSLIKGKTFRKPEKLSSNVMDGQRNAGNKTFTLHSKPNLQKCLSKAAEIEQQSQDEYWRQEYPGVDENTIVIGNTRYILAMQTPPESTDVKLDTLNEPSAHLIEKNVALPKDIFRSYLSYWIYEIARYTPVMILSLVIGVLVLLIIFFNDNEACLAFSVPFLLIFSVILVLVLILRFGPQISDEDFKCKLLMEIITRKPTVKGKEWRTITYKMNQYLFDNDLWNTPYYFYRDEDCHRYFLSLIKGRTFKKQKESSASNVKDAQSNDETAGTPNEAAESSSFSAGPNFIKLLTKAAEIEQQFQKEYWRQEYPGVDEYILAMQTPPESTDVKLDTLNEPSAHLIEKNVALPKDIFRSYLSYWIYEIARYTPVMILSLVIGVLVLLIIFFNDNEACVFNSAYFAFLSLVGLLIILGDGNPKLVSRRNFRTELLVDVITRKPAVEGKEWRIITYNMNQYLFNHGQWHTPYYFYSDEDCYRYFLRLVEGVTPKKQTATSIGNSPVTAKPEDAIESASPIVVIIVWLVLSTVHLHFHDNKPCVFVLGILLSPHFFRLNSSYKHSQGCHDLSSHDGNHECIVQSKGARKSMIEKTPHLDSICHQRLKKSI
ncbi:CCC_1a_G0000820.mRNA.1.CDS.1 [Saccharomyces cerevisiae]|nr:CCC_1a_G0000820.mRNA.1.CDS.1 [Saccharomyces cerevisiae]CAI7128742.1 CCC_1a_G0000820.mRNA.1.CDS.1 [Saccharomyces cerevisiae]